MQRIVVVGGGAGGLELVTKLGHQFGKSKQAEVILVDRSFTHIWKPLLHEVATGSLDVNTDGINYRAHAAKHYYKFQLGNVIAVDPDNKKLTLQEIRDDKDHSVLPERTVKFDTLIMAVGSVSNDFGTPGVAEHCYFLDSHQQAERFQQALLNQFLRINQQGEDSHLNIAIVGAGATGVELSAELFHVADLLRTYGMPLMSGKRIRVTLVEAGPRILPALPDRIANNARKELAKLGVELKENTRIVSASDEGLTTADNELIRADLMIWAAGVKAPDFIKQIPGFQTTRTNQIVVKGTLQVPNYDKIFVIGDCCACQQPNGKMVPPRAQSAHQMADIVFANIKAQFRSEPLNDYIYKDYGSLVNLSRYSTVGSLMGNLMKGSMFVEGRIARFVYVSLYRLHLIAIHGWFKAMIIMAAQRIAKVVKPKLKLH
ncbi:NAD(P)/FAD-dependent oxidoreductase [Maribrevibacterium harenarium]|uniref:NAD(P)/FAD-dependent oxidoreductase n=1 Tax=Maribrevibacterium harenarium TaxID=2589817 RepID=A0A501X5C1_9GAMM|nr:NAD(P)/FAD-dependent oxidoreductase [Maribrevibacterium harenarium]TPE55706.1 NAD(P)/FAD-dependent oxidoreductase [Maribrevibacterium harenarium]